MGLSEYEKYKIYKNEETKRILVDKHHEISERDKNRIIEEYSEKNICLIDETKLILPNAKLKNIEKIVPWIGGLILIFSGLYYFILFTILYIAIVIFLRASKGITKDEILAIIKCPTCHREDISRMDRDSFEFLKTKTLETQCTRCNVDMDLILSPNAIKILEKNKNIL